jgi:hypothetical protein
MSWLKQYFIFVLFFTADIHVKASNDFRERPTGCLNNEATCALQTQKDVFHFKNPRSEFHLAPQSLVIRNSSENFELVKGTAWFEKFENMTVKTIYGEVKAVEGPFWVIEAKDRIWVRNINSKITIQPRNGKPMELPVGFQVWMAGVDENGKPLTGIPEVIPVETHIKIWSQLYPGKKEDFKNEVEELKWTWGPVADRAAQLYVKIVDRQKQMAEDREAEIQRRKLATEQENQKVRNLFIEKAFFR